MQTLHCHLLAGLFLGLIALQPLGAVPVTIMPLGDSITKGAGDPGPSNSGYRARLFDLLQASHRPFQFIGCTDNNSNPAQFAAGQQFHNGYGTFRIDGLRDNLDGSRQPDGDNNMGGYWLTGHPGNGRSAVAPDIVLLLAGTNDLGQNTSEPELEKRMTDLLAWLQKNRPRAQIFVGTVPPRGKDKPDSEAYNHAVDNFNHWLAGKLPLFGLHFHLVEINALFLDKAGHPKESDSPDGIFLSDGIHPSHSGYVAMGDAWFKAIQPYLGK